MIRRWILWLLVIGFVWLVVSRYAELQNLAMTLAEGQLTWVLLALGLQALYFTAFAASYQAALYTVEVKSRLRHLIPMVFSALFVNVVTPAAGTAGVALFVEDASRRGEPPARAAAGTLLQLIADFTAFTLVLIVGLGYLFAQHNLQTYEVLAALILLLMTGGLSSVLLLGLWQPALLRGLLSWLQGTANRLGQRLGKAELFAEDWAERNALEYNHAAAAISRHPKRLVVTLGVALVAHLLDISSLYALFRAFGQRIEAGPLIAGYTIGILFWIVSITPQGIGVVEGVMALVYTSLEVPSNIATIVALTFRGLSFWIPLALGFVLIRRLKTFRHERHYLTEVWSVRLVALLTAAMGVINVLSAVTPSLPARITLLGRISPLEVRHGGHLTTALAGFALLMVAGNLWRRKHVAWLVTLIVLVLSAFTHLVKGLDYEEALLAAGLALWLWLLRFHFQALSDPPSVRQGLRALTWALVFTMAYGTVGFYLLDRHYQVDFGLWAAVRQTVIMFTQFYDPGLQPITGFGRYFASSIYIIGVTALAYALFMLVRPVLIRWPATSDERAHANVIVEAYGRSPLARMTLFNDKSYYFSPGGAFVAYAVRGRVAVALGDPIGPEEEIKNAIYEFKDLCARNDWQPAFYQTLPDNLGSYRSAGFEALCIGHEAIVDLATFSLEGRANKDLRWAVNRLTRLDYYARVHPPPLSNDLLEKLRSISDEWLVGMHGSEKRFSLGWFEDDYIQNSPVLVIQDPDGAILAFANIVPEYQRNEVTIDLMRHKRDIIPGTMDFLFISLFRWAREQGYTTFNLGLSAFSGVGEQPEDPMAERALHFIYEHVNQFYNFKGLHQFKDKFHPHWEPRYLVYPGPTALPAVALAIVRADSGKGLLTYFKRS